MLHNRQITNAEFQPVSLVQRGADGLEKLLRSRINGMYLSRENRFHFECFALFKI